MSDCVACLVAKTAFETKPGESNEYCSGTCWVKSRNMTQISFVEAISCKRLR